MANGIRTGNPCGFDKGRSSKFREGSRVWQTPEEGRRIYRLKHCGNNNEDEDNSLKTLNDKNHQASSQKFRQLISILLCVSFTSTHWKTYFLIITPFTRVLKKTVFLIFFILYFWSWNANDNLKKHRHVCLLIGIILRWGFLIWELIFFFKFIADFLSSSW